VLDHVGLPASDRERSMRFYAEALSPLVSESRLWSTTSPGWGSGSRASRTSGSEKVYPPPPSTSRSPPTTPKVRFFATVGEEPEVEVALV